MAMMAAAGLCALGCMGAVEIRPGAVDVVVEKKAPPAVWFAADELTNFLSRALGAVVPVVSSPSGGRFSIVLGENEWSRAAGIDVSADPRDTFVIKTAPGRLFIAGRDGSANPLKALTGCERATLHGVYAFLEDYVGCRFYFPGELGEVVPRHSSLAIPDIDRRTRPDFLIRRYYNSERDGRWFDPAVDETRAKALNWLRVRASTIDIPCCHGMNKIDLVKKYAKTHPEYFALRKDGTRCTNFMGYRSSIKGYPCFSNRGLRDVVVDWCVEQAAKGAKYVDIMPNDALQPCHCADCQAAYAASGEDCPMSELVWGYTKYVADRLKEKGVDVIVTQMAYAQYRRIPRGVDIPGNVRVMVAEPGPWALSNPGELRRQYDEIRAWKEKSGNPIWIWTYPHKYWSLAVPGLLDVAPKTWGDYYKPLKDDILGTFAESETDRWLYHYLNYYVFSRVMWNAETDVDAVLDEHHRLMFGAAAEPMKAFYETLESKWTRDLAGKVKDSPLGPVTVPPTEPEIWERIYSRSEADRLAAMLDKAAASVASGSLEARRIALVRREYLEPIVAAIGAYSSRREAIKSLVYEAGRDGPIELRPFRVRKGREPEEYVRTAVTIRRAGDALVVRYDAEDNRMDDMQGTRRAADDPETWRDASLEIYFNPSADMKTYYHIIVNLEGSISDSKGVRTGARNQIVDSSWNSGATAKIDKRADGWTAEVRIPLAPLGEVNDAFPAEFVRNRNTRSGKGQCLYNWSPYVYGFNSIDQFGTVRLSSHDAVAIRPGAVDVVLPKKPLPIERFAADELTNFLSRVLGAPVPVVEKAVAGRSAILLGRSAGFDVSALERDAFRTKVECAANGGAVIRIAGRDGNDDVFRHAWKSGATVRDECATLFGVYAFLEDFAGVRFYFPGELGTVANRRDAVVTPVQDKTTAPWFIVRSTIISRDGVWYEPLPSGWHPNAGKALCWLRHRFETARIPCCHGQNKFKIVERFAATHPEYCQLRKDGTRCTALKRERVGYHQKQLCQSSGIWSVFHDDIVASGRTGYVDVMPQDGYRPCECEACQASYRRNPDGSLPESYASELVWGQTAKLARRFLAEGRTDLTLTQMSYGAYKEVPNIDLPTNILVMVAVPGPWRVHDQKAHAASLERVRAWDRKTGRRVWLWTYPHKFFTT
ncbi:MAG: DUF4838 domain-containing protein, partial [Kiritimatiellae bacterium]|nr:DUF4838 domain-containing protein [Kiritimatiellia bacterium]